MSAAIDLLSARSLLGRADAWSQWCNAWWSISCVMREDFAPEPDREEYEPTWSELGWQSASLGGAW